MILSLAQTLHNKGQFAHKSPQCYFLLKTSISVVHRYGLRRYGFPGTRRRQMVQDIKGLNHWVA